jgi:hemerythrin superfamily protein
MGRTGGIALGAAALGFLAGAAVVSPVRKFALQGLESTAGDWFDVLAAEHKLVEGLFDLLLQTKDDEKTKRQGLLTKIAYNLNKHAIQEENAIYPALRKVDREQAEHLVADHGTIKSWLAEIQYNIEKDDPQWLEAARTLRDHLLTHIREEEDEIFPRLREALSQDENASLTRRMHWEGIKVA